MTAPMVLTALLGVLLGVLGTGAASMFLIGGRVSAVEVELKHIRRDLDVLLEK